MLYYGLTLSAGDLGEMDFLAFFLSGAVEIPAYFFCLYFLDKWGRRPVQAMFFFISGIACLVTTFLREYDWLYRVSQKKVYSSIIG